MSNGPAIHIPTNDRYRISLNVKQDGSWGMSVAGPHTPHEAIGLLVTAAIAFAMTTINHGDQKDIMEKLNAAFRS